MRCRWRVKRGLLSTLPVLEAAREASTDIHQVSRLRRKHDFLLRHQKRDFLLLDVCPMRSNRVWEVVLHLHLPWYGLWPFPKVNFCLLNGHKGGRSIFKPPNQDDLKRCTCKRAEKLRCIVEVADQRSLRRQIQQLDHPSRGEQLGMVQEFAERCGEKLEELPGVVWRMLRHCWLKFLVRLDLCDVDPS